MTETRLGRQTPTQSVTIPYSKTRGQEAAELYAKTGNELLEWQQLLQWFMDASEIWLFSAETKRKVGKCVGALPMGTEKRRKNSIHGTQSNNITRSVGAAGSNVRKSRNQDIIII